MKVCHLSSAHNRNDIRIYQKMCISLAAAGFDTTFVVADGKGDDKVEGVSIYDVGDKGSSRLKRMTKAVYRVYKKALEVKAEVYHLHDPELMFIGVLLKSKGYKVIFDAHEDLPKQLASKPYFNKFMRWFMPKVFASIEAVCFRFYNGLVGATPSITDKLSSLNSNAVTINNYPIFGELKMEIKTQRTTDVCYLGGISEIRGIKEMVRSLDFLTQSKLQLAGNFSSNHLHQEVASYEGWNKVNELGMINRIEAAELLSTSLAGLVLFHAVPNHVEAQPNKLFEYMSAGLPVICSNFPMWKELIEENSCGICVDPMDPKAIADAINHLINNPELVKQMGENGFNAVQNKYNWAQEEQVLLDFYRNLN